MPIAFVRSIHSDALNTNDGKPALILKWSKFDHFEIRVMNHLPSAEKFNGVTVPQPVFYNVGRTIIALFGSCHISRRYNPVLLPRTVIGVF